MTTESALVVAKAPVAGEVKTRLGATVGPDAAARLAAAALLDTIDACATAYGAAACHLALSGDLAAAVDGRELADRVTGWQVAAQRGDGLGERLAHAYAGVSGPVVQVGMDTPQLTRDLLRSVTDGLRNADAVLGPAEDGGWWALALREPAAARALAEVVMSTPTTYADTRAALEATGLRVGTAPVLRDVDQADDAAAVAAAVPHTRFARAWSELGR